FQFDREHGIHSVPARFGLATALRIARATHFLAWLGFALTGWLYGAGAAYFLGVLCAGLVLWYEHRLVSPSNLSKIDAAFFQANVVISLGMFTFIALETLL
ncbi:MAG: 4-hydroxybenzoate octaprenyltransferase, partial [Armatimonadota bacterium]